ncbi:predicted transcription regulator, ArsR family [Thermococcus kodakarensis KOD1]|uniref:Predicted transcription regulator, ArsR family n=1 Tax=Thermococcus kodakarensis (strain ATCC BAA-918 / JCM 12380 / KOD1) TaxID=69014 RepID=Q5JEK0_THEKO|nr:ArsR family transcriptional regulator [Thermococcus kodakarensis]WCN28200.1 ArsR family transcriptional regulator [Thermococcus kodakarensis]WCN30497.1 ArsR family transcriptional regulator [Thermococcus kodakarensis]BAD84275.1 predicted transcription regulator, ArsR family [Thermococcus kodakarensis KOD1]
MVVGNSSKGLVESIDVIIERSKNAKLTPEKKYIDIAKTVAKKAEATEKEARGLPNIYVTRKLELAFETIERLKEALEYAFKGIYSGEDVEEKINSMRRVFGRKAHLRTKILMTLLIHGEMKSQDIAKILRKDESTISKAMKFLLLEGYVVRGENGLKLRPGIEDALWELFDDIFGQLEEILLEQTLEGADE